MGLSTVKTPWS